jgi:hypothetical protein
MSAAIHVLLKNCRKAKGRRPINAVGGPRMQKSNEERIKSEVRRKD